MTAARSRGTSIAKVTTNRAYDTLSRMIRESRGALSLTRQHDAADNVTQLGYPSGAASERTFDLGNRLLRVGAESQVSYGYRVFDVLESRTRRGIQGLMQHDAGRRPVSTEYRTPAGTKVFGEASSWDGRGLKLTQSRTDLNGAGRSFGYDDARASHLRPRSR